MSCGMYSSVTFRKTSALCRWFTIRSRPARLCDNSATGGQRQGRQHDRAQQLAQEISVDQAHLAAKKRLTREIWTRPGRGPVLIHASPRRTT
jgi:hypothetical protein